MNPKREYTKFESYRFKFKADEQLSDTLQTALTFAYNLKESYNTSSDVVKNRPELYHFKPKAVSDSIGKTLFSDDKTDNSYYIYCVPSNHHINIEFKFLDRDQKTQSRKLELRGYSSGFYSNSEFNEENVFLIEQASILFIAWLKGLEKIIHTADQDFTFDLKEASQKPITQRRKALNSIDDLATLKTTLAVEDGRILELALTNILSDTQFRHFQDRCDDLRYEMSFSK